MMLSDISGSCFTLRSVLNSHKYNYMNQYYLIDWTAQFYNNVYLHAGLKLHPVLKYRIVED